MKQTCGIHYWIDNLHLSYARDLPGGGWESVTITGENYKECAKELHCHPELLRMLLSLVYNIKLYCRREFEQIYRMLDAPELAEGNEIKGANASSSDKRDLYKDAV